MTSSSRRDGNPSEEELRALIKEFVYGASHEINNPLANIASRAQLLLRDELRPEVRRSLVAIHEQALRAYDMLADLMFYANPPAPQPTCFLLSEWLAELLDLVARECEACQVALAVASENLSTAECVVADRAQLTAAALAICKNAIQAAWGNEGLEIRLEDAGKPSVDSADRRSSGSSACDADPRHDLTPPGEQGGVLSVPGKPNAHGRGLAILIRDGGAGVEDALRDRIFFPFFSGREAGRGIGFGLCKAARVAEAHRGRLDLVHSRPGDTLFRLWIPHA